VAMTRAAHESRQGALAPEPGPASDSRMDNLLARSLAHRAVLELLVGLALPTEEERSLACASAARGLEELRSFPMAESASEALQRGIAELEEVFGIDRASSVSPPERRRR